VMMEYHQKAKYKTFDCLLISLRSDLYFGSRHVSVRRNHLQVIRISKITKKSWVMGGLYIN